MKSSFRGLSERYTVMLAATLDDPRRSQRTVGRQTIHLTVHRETRRQITTRLERATLEGPRYQIYTAVTPSTVITRPLQDAGIPVASPRCHVPPASHRRLLSSSDAGERSALTGPFDGTPENQQNDGHQRHQRRQEQQRQQQRGTADQRAARTGGGFRGWISHAVIHHIAGYRRTVRLCRGTAYRRGVHCVAGIRVVRRIPGASAGVMGQAGGVGDRVRDIALVDATGEQGAREGPDGEHRHILAPVRRPRPRHARRL